MRGLWAWKARSPVMRGGVRGPLTCHGVRAVQEPKWLSLQLNGEQKHLALLGCVQLQRTGGWEGLWVWVSVGSRDARGGARNRGGQEGACGQDQHPGFPWEVTPLTTTWLQRMAESFTHTVLKLSSGPKLHRRFAPCGRFTEEL